MLFAEFARFSRSLLAAGVLVISIVTAPAHARTFSDVPPSYWAYSFIETFAASGITGGCGGGRYCPEQPVSRAQMAVFLERGIRGSDYLPPPASGNVFLDVAANDFAASYIEQMLADGITGGCGSMNYCPGDSISRAQMAVFLLRAKYGAGYTPPPATGTRFADVDSSYWAVSWIEQLADEGVTGGCGAGNYCPEQPVSRAQMAVFLVRVFRLGLTQEAYVKASNTDPGDGFGGGVSLSGDGSTLVVGAGGEQSAATGVDGDQADNSGGAQGAVYVFTRDEADGWAQQSYIKKCVADPNVTSFYLNDLSDDGATLAVISNVAVAVCIYTRDGNGAWSSAAYLGPSEVSTFIGAIHSVALSGEGSTLVVGSPSEDGGSSGIDGDESDTSLSDSGAAYVFARDNGGQWSRQAYVKASNPGQGHRFGTSVALSADGSTLAVGAYREGSAATGVNGDQTQSLAGLESGAAYVFVRDAAGAWSQQAYVKASNTGTLDNFGRIVALSDDGNTLAVSAWEESSGAAGVDGDQSDNSEPSAGAVYVYARDASDEWSQQAYVKATNPDANDFFGTRLALSANGSLLAVSANGEASGATGVNGNQADNSTTSAGAVYVYSRDDAGAWTPESYVKASNTGSDGFGRDLDLSNDGTTLAAGAVGEDSSATGIDGNQLDNSAQSAGAVYVFR